MYILSVCRLGSVLKKYYNTTLTLPVVHAVSCSNVPTGVHRGEILPLSTCRDDTMSDSMTDRTPVPAAISGLPPPPSVSGFVVATRSGSSLIDSRYLPPPPGHMAQVVPVGNRVIAQDVGMYAPPLEIEQGAWAEATPLTPAAPSMPAVAAHHPSAAQVGPIVLMTLPSDILCHVFHFMPLRAVLTDLARVSRTFFALTHGIGSSWFPHTVRVQELHEQLEDVNLAQLAVRWPTLRILDLSRCAHVTDHSLAVVTHHCPHLSALILNHCTQLTDMTLMHISAHCQQLSTFSISGCVLITDRGFYHFAAATPSLGQGLRYIDVGQLPRITDSGMCSRGRPTL
jgi:hypothetical protein